MANLNVMVEKEVQGSGSRKYTIKLYDNDTVSCTCPAWRFQKGVSVTERQCKHTKAFLPPLSLVTRAVA